MRVQQWLQTQLWPFVVRYAWVIGLVAGTEAVLILAYLMMGHSGVNPFRGWVMWDAHHYLYLAEHGYRTHGEAAYYIVFFPLFPVLVWLGHWLTAGNFMASALVLANVLAGIAGVLLYKLARIDEHEVVARRAVWLLFLFPTAMFLHLPYTESLMLVLAIGSLYAARKRRYDWAIVLACLAVLTRMQGLAVVPALLAELWVQDRHSVKRWKLWLASALLPALAFGYYLGLNAMLFGSPWHFLTAERLRWGWSPTPIWHGAERALWVVQHFELSMNVVLLGHAQLVAVALGLLGVVYSFAKLRLSYAVYATGILGLSTAMSHWSSVPRYILVMFPLYLMMARWGRRRWVFWLEAAVLGSLSALLIVAAVLGAQMY